MSHYSNIILGDSPMVYLRLNETSGTVAYDSSGNGYHATVSGATLSQAGSLIGDSDTSMLFTAGGGVTFPAAFNYTAWTAFSLAFRVNLIDGTGWHDVVVASDATSTILYSDNVVVIGTPGASLFIAALFDKAGSFTVAGYLDEVSVYQSKLSSHQVYNHYIVALAGNAGTYNAVIGGQAVTIVRGTLSVQSTIGKRAQASFTIYQWLIG